MDATALAPCCPAPFMAVVKPAVVPLPTVPLPSGGGTGRALEGEDAGEDDDDPAPRDTGTLGGNGGRLLG